MDQEKIDSGIRKKHQTSRKGRLFFLSLVFFVFAISTVSHAHAASLSIVPSSGSYSVGSYITAAVYVSNAQQAINAASGMLSFSKENLEVTSLSKTGSVFNLWVQEPTFSNTTGVINFEGIVFNPGFIGTSGKIISVTFRAKKAGTATISFSSGSILANDGWGTNVLSGLGKSSLAINASTPQAPSLDRPVLPRVSSPTHSNSDVWYANNTPTFVWELPEDATGVNFLADKNPDTDPGAQSDGLMSSYTYENVADGIWYLHIKIRNSAGWSDVAHFRFQIDAQKPSPFVINEVISTQKTEGVAQFTFGATDETSGIDHYEIQIDGTLFERWTDDGVGAYTTPLLSQGNHIIAVQAVDKAGNATIQSKEFFVNAVVVTSSTQSSSSWWSVLLMRFGSQAVTVLAIVVPIVALIFLIGWMLIHGYRKFLALRRRIKKEHADEAVIVHKKFELLREHIRDYLLLLEKARIKRQLTPEEEKIAWELKKDLDEADVLVLSNHQEKKHKE